MADNVSPEMGSEPAELTLDDIAARRAQASIEAETPETPEDQEQESSDEEPAEAVEAETDELEEEPASEEDAEPEAKDDVLIKMDDGSTITVAELKAEASTLKTENARISQEVANERRELQQASTKLSETFEFVLGKLAEKLPPEPDDSLLWSNPAQHHQMVYLREAAIKELQAWFAPKNEVDQLTNQLSEADFKKYEAAENAKLIAAVPNLKDPARMKAAMEKAKSYAKSIGFSDDEFDKTVDARIRRMVVDAAYGRDAREAAQKAKVQVKTAVAKSPTAQRQVHPNSLRALTANNAIKRAQQTGNLEDVLAARLARQK